MTLYRHTLTGEIRGMDSVPAHKADLWDVYTPPTPTAEEAAAAIAADYTARLEALYDSVAQQRRYDNRLTCALRAGYVGPFQAEGEAFAQWMDACNALGYEIMADVQAGIRTLPTWEELQSELPAAPW